MREVLQKLEIVQEIDSKIGVLLSKKADFPKRLVAFEQEIKTQTQKLSEKKKIVEELEKSLRQQDGALELNEERIKRSQEKLEQIKTNQEFQALQKEIESLKKSSAVITENATKVKADIEPHRKEMGEVESALAALTAKREAETSQIGSETGTIDADLSKLQTERKAAIAGLDPRHLATYDRVRTNRLGIGVVAAIGGNCKGCNMRIPPQIYIEIQRSEDLHLCPSCRRILIYKDPIKGESSL